MAARGLQGLGSAGASSLFALGLGCHLLCLRAGAYCSLVQGGRELALGGRMCPSEGCSRGGRSRLGRCQWATGDSSFCRRRRRSSAASGSPSSGSSSVPADSGAEGFSGSGAGGEAPGDGVVASELGMLVEEVAATALGAVSSVG